MSILTTPSNNRISSQNITNPMYESPLTPDVPCYEAPGIFKERSSWYSLFQRSVKSTPYRITGLLQAQGLHRWCLSFVVQVDHWHLRGFHIVRLQARTEIT